MAKRKTTTRSWNSGDALQLSRVRPGTAMGSCSMYRSAGELRVLSDGEENRPNSSSSDDDFADDEYSVRVEVYETEVTGSCSSGSSPIIKISGLHASGGLVRLCSSTHYLPGNAKPPCVQPLPTGRLVYTSNKSLPILQGHPKRHTAVHKRVSSPAITCAGYDSHNAVAAAHPRHASDARLCTRKDAYKTDRTERPMCSFISVREQMSQISNRTFTVHPEVGTSPSKICLKQGMKKTVPLGSARKPETTSTFRSPVTCHKTGDKDKSNEKLKVDGTEAKNAETQKDIQQSGRKASVFANGGSNGGRVHHGEVCSCALSQRSNCHGNRHKSKVHNSKSTFCSDCPTLTEQVYFSLPREAGGIPPTTGSLGAPPYCSSTRGLNCVEETVTTRMLPAELLQPARAARSHRRLCCHIHKMLSIHSIYPMEASATHRTFPQHTKSRSPLRSHKRTRNSCYRRCAEDVSTSCRAFRAFSSFDATASVVQSGTERAPPVRPHDIKPTPCDGGPSSVDKETQTSTGSPLPHVFTSLIEWFALTCQNFVSRFAHVPGMKTSAQQDGRNVPLHVTLGKSLQNLLAHDANVWWTLVKHIHDGITGFTNQEAPYVSTSTRRSAKTRVQGIPIAGPNAVVMTANVLEIPTNANLFEKRKGMGGEGECITIFKRQERKRRQQWRKELPKRTSSELDLRDLCAAELMSAVCVPQMGNTIEHRWSCTKF